jgi:predicted nucleotidyltransferase
MTTRKVKVQTRIQQMKYNLAETVGISALMMTSRISCLHKKGKIGVLGVY